MDASTEPTPQHVASADDTPRRRRSAKWWGVAAAAIVAVVATTATVTVLVLDDDEASAEERAAICSDVRTMVAFMRQQPNDPRWTVEIEEQAIAAGNVGDGDLEDALRDWSVNHLLGDFTGAGNATRKVAALCEEV